MIVELWKASDNLEQQIAFLSRAFERKAKLEEDSNLKNVKFDLIADASDVDTTALRMLFPHLAVRWSSGIGYDEYKMAYQLQHRLVRRVCNVNDI